MAKKLERYRNMPKGEMRRQKLGIEFSQDGYFEAIVGMEVRWWAWVDPLLPIRVKVRIINDRREHASSGDSSVQHPHMCGEPTSHSGSSDTAE